MRQIVAVAVVAVACIVSVTVLAALHADTTAVVGVIMSGLVPLASGLIYGKVDAIHQQTNGNLGRLLDIIERQSGQLAAAQPPPADQPTGGAP